MTPPARGAPAHSPSGGAAPDIGGAWPSARARVARILAARGVQPADADDIAQEVAVRALRDPGRFRSNDHFLGWCCRVAINLHIDAVRRQRWISPRPSPDVPGGHDTAGAVEGRLALETLASELAQLSDEERDLLLVAPPGDSRIEAVRLAVRRHRLRARLAACLEGLVAVIALLRRAARGLSTPAKMALVALPVVAGVLIAPLVVPPPSAPLADEARPARYAPDPLGVQERLLDVVSPARTPRAERRPNAPALTSRPASSLPSSSRRTSLVEVKPGGTPVKLTKDEHPDTRPAFCLFGHLSVCVDPPVQRLPEPSSPPLR